MKSIKELYRIGTGPSSSHTMGPRKAAEMFLERHPDAASFKVTLYGSLAATGKGHMTDVAIIDTLQPAAPVEIIWQPKVFLPFHPNGMTFAAFDANNKVTENLQHRRRRTGRKQQHPDNRKPGSIRHEQHDRDTAMVRTYREKLLGIRERM